MARCSRESATRCAAGSGASSTSREAVGEPRPLVAGERLGGCEPGGAGLDDAAEGQGVAHGRTAAHEGAGGARGQLGRTRSPGAPATSASGRHEARVAQGGDRLAQRVAADAEPFGELALGRELLAAGEDAEPDAPSRAVRRCPRRRCRWRGAARRPAGTAVVRLRSRVDPIPSPPPRQWSEKEPLGRVGPSLPESQPLRVERRPQPDRERVPLAGQVDHPLPRAYPFRRGPARPTVPHERQADAGPHGRPPRRARHLTDGSTVPAGRAHRPTGRPPGPPGRTTRPVAAGSRPSRPRRLAARGSRRPCRACRRRSTPPPRARSRSSARGRTRGSPSRAAAPRSRSSRRPRRPRSSPAGSRSS